MKILIVEDERPASERLIQLVRKVRKDAEILGVTESVEQTVNWMSCHPDPDLILMDIQLEDGLSFEVFESIKVVAPVIFTTAYDAYALKAFRVNSVDYLLKPVEAEALKLALEKFDRLYGKTTTQGFEWTKLLEQLSPPKKQRFLVKSGQKFRSVQTSEITLFEAAAGCTFMKTFGGQHYDVDFTLEQLEKLLDPAQFFRIARGCIVNLDAIGDMIALSGSKLKIKLKNDPSPDGIMVSRERIHEFKAWVGAGVS